MSNITFLKSSTNQTPLSLGFGTPAWSDVNGIKRFFIGDVNNHPYLVSDNLPLAQAGAAITIDANVSPPKLSVNFDNLTISTNTSNQLIVLSINGGEY